MAKEIRVPEKVIYVCNGSSCKKKGGKELRKFFKKQAERLNTDVQVIKTGCTDNCKNAAIVCVQPDNTWYGKVDLEKAAKILASLGGSREAGPDREDIPDYD